MITIVRNAEARRHEVRALHDRELAGNYQGFWDHGPHHGDTLLLAEDDGVAIGYLFMEIIGDYAVLYEVAVESTHRGLGVGRSLLHEAVQAARDVGVAQLYIKPLPGEGHDRLTGYYRRMGFVGPVEQSHLSGAVTTVIEATATAGGAGS